MTFSNNDSHVVIATLSTKINDSKLWFTFETLGSFHKDVIQNTLTLTLSCIVLKNDQTYLKNLAERTPRDFKVCLVIL